jgi:hypothetical protein
MEGKMASNKKSVPNLSGLARGSAPTKSHKNAPGRHRFGADNQPPKGKVGRPKGSRNKLTKSVTELLIRAAAEVGDSTEAGKDGKGGALGYLKVSAVTERRAYLALFGRALPLHVDANISHKPILTLEQAEAELKARGLPPGLIEYLRAVDDELGEDDEPDPYDDVVDLEAEPPAETEE